MRSWGDGRLSCPSNGCSIRRCETAHSPDLADAGYSRSRRLVLGRTDHLPHAARAIVARARHARYGARAGAGAGSRRQRHQDGRGDAGRLAVSGRSRRSGPLLRRGGHDLQGLWRLGGAVRSVGPTGSQYEPAAGLRAPDPHARKPGDDEGRRGQPEDVRVEHLHGHGQPTAGGDRGRAGHPRRRGTLRSRLPVSAHAVHQLAAGSVALARLDRRDHRSRGRRGRASAGRGGVRRKKRGSGVDDTDHRDRRGIHQGRRAQGAAGLCGLQAIEGDRVDRRRRRAHQAGRCGDPAVAPRAIERWLPAPGHRLRPRVRARQAHCRPDRRSRRFAEGAARGAAASGPVSSVRGGGFAPGPRGREDGGAPRRAGARRPPGSRGREPGEGRLPGRLVP